MIAKAFAMYMGGSKEKRPVRRAPYPPESRPVRLSK